MDLILETLTPESFSEFGQVIDADNSANNFLINGGSTRRFHDLADTEVIGDAKAGVSIFRGEARKLPMAITMLERHPYGSQAFMPLQQQPYLIVVAPSLNKDQPDLDKLRLFYAKGNQGINYARGTWHHPLLALHNESDFLVIDRIGEGHNCDEFDFPNDCNIHIDDMNFDNNIDER